MKKFFAAILALVMAMSLVACGSNGGNAGDNTASDSSVTLTAIVAGLTEDSPSGQALKKFAELTNQYSNGSVTIDCFFNTELGNVAACVEGATQGTIDIVSTGTSYFAGFVPAIQVFELPYIFNSYDEAHKTLDNEPGKAVADMFEGSGLKMLCYWESGMRHVTNSRGPIVEPSDMKGLKIRTMQSDLHTATFEALGCLPTPMSSSEVYSSLSSGVIDAAENCYSYVLNQSMYEVAPYIINTEHFYGFCVIMMAEKIFQSLTAEQQQIILDASANCISFQRDLVAQQNSDAVDALKEKGVEFIDLDKAELQAKVEPVYEKYADKLPADIMEKIRNT